MEADNSTVHISSRLVTVASFVFIIAVLQFGKDIFVPLTLSALLAFLLAPFSNRIERLGISRMISVPIVVLIGIGIFAAVAVTVAYQLADLAERLPEYKGNIVAKIEPIRMLPGQWSGKVNGTFKELKETLYTEPVSPKVAEANPKRNTLPPGEAIPVEIVSTRTSTVTLIKDMVGPALRPIADALVVCLFTIVMLLKREDLRDRFLGLIGQAKITMTTQAIEEAALRISRYLVMQFLLNMTYGIAIGAGLAVIGVPNAALWGLLTALLKFVPYVGAWIAASMPLLIALAVFESWTQPMLSAGLFLIVEVVAANILEPWMYGSSTGLSPVAILVATFFWAWLWGGVGLLLATPLTVCIFVIGRYVPELSFLNIVLGDRPVLAPHVQFYQRLVAMDQQGAAKLADKSAFENSLSFLYDSIIVPALCLFENDRHQAKLDESKQEFALQSIREIVDELGESQIDSPASRASSEDILQSSSSRVKVLCIPARDEADEIVATILAQVLSNGGQNVDLLPAALSMKEKIHEVIESRPDVVFISAVPPFAGVLTRALAKKIRSVLPTTNVITGIWTGMIAKAESDDSQAPLTQAKPERRTQSGTTVVSIVEAVSELENFVAGQTTASNATP